MNSNIEKSDKTSFVKISEQPSLYSDLEKKSVREILEDINTEDQKVALAVQKAIPQIEKLVTQIVPRMKQGGRIFYMGAGTSGRLGVLDASEIPPTFGMPPTLIIGLIAGGDTALRNPVENAEDNTTRGWEELTEHNINSKDTVHRYCSLRYDSLCDRSHACGTRARHPHRLHHQQPELADGRRSRCTYRNDCRPRICNRQFAHEIRNRTEDDPEHDHNLGYDSTGTRERQQDGQYAA